MFVWEGVTGMPTTVKPCWCASGLIKWNVFEERCLITSLKYSEKDAVLAKSLVLTSREYRHDWYEAPNGRKLVFFMPIFSVFLSLFLKQRSYTHHNSSKFFYNHIRWRLSLSFAWMMGVRLGLKVCNPLKRETTGKIWEPPFSLCFVGDFVFAAGNLVVHSSYW